MALNDLLNLSHSKETVKMGMSEERLKDAVAEGRKIISFLRCVHVRMSANQALYHKQVYQIVTKVDMCDEQLSYFYRTSVALI